MLMIVSKKKYNEEMKAAYEKGQMEAQEQHWQSQNNDELRKMIYDLGERVERMENKGKKPKFRCPCMTFTAR